VLRIIHVWHSPAFPTDPVLPIPDWQSACVESAASIASTAEPSVQVATHVQAGLPSVTLLQMSQGASLLALGGHHRKLLDRIIFGSVTTHVLARASCPVVVVRPPRQADRSQARLPVVVGVDHEDSSLDALEFAFEFAHLRNLELVTVQAWTAPELSVSGQDARTTLRSLQDSLTGGLQPLREKYPDVNVITIAACQEPVHALLDWSDKASLLVVGSRGRGYFTGMLLGSVSSAVAHQASCSVAVVRPRNITQLLDAMAS